MLLELLSVVLLVCLTLILTVFDLLSLFSYYLNNTHCILCIQEDPTLPRKVYHKQRRRMAQSSAGSSQSVERRRAQSVEAAGRLGIPGSYYVFITLCASFYQCQLIYYSIEHENLVNFLEYQLYAC